jgi:hypothetical protein
MLYFSLTDSLTKFSFLGLTAKGFTTTVCFFIFSSSVSQPSVAQKAPHGIAYFMPSI